MRGNAPQVVEALWAAKEEPPAKLVGFSFTDQSGDYSINRNSSFLPAILPYIWDHTLRESAIPCGEIGKNVVLSIRTYSYLGL